MRTCQFLTTNNCAFPFSFLTTNKLRISLSFFVNNPIVRFPFFHSTQIHTMYYVNVNGKHFRFIDVTGNGNCFFHSVLKHHSLAERFGKDDQMSLRQYLSSVVLSCFQNDNVLQSLFMFEGITCKDWCDSIVIDGRWTSTFDVIVFAYLMKVYVITVGNYLNGFSIQSARNSFFIINPHLDVASRQYIPEEPKVHLISICIYLP